jgi:hypothetical protein
VSFPLTKPGESSVLEPLSKIPSEIALDTSSGTLARTLYDRDWQLWVEQTIQHLENQEFELLDIEHLIQELADLGRSEKNALKGNLMILLAHLLKLRVQCSAPETMKTNWYSSVLEHRQRVLNHLIDTPSLKSFLMEAVEKAYPDGRKLAIMESKWAKFGVSPPPESDYPTECPFSIAEILEEDFYGI